MTAVAAASLAAATPASASFAWASGAWLPAGGVSYSGSWYPLQWVYCHELDGPSRKIGAGSVDYGGFVYDWTAVTRHYGSAPWGRPACANPHTVGYVFNGRVETAGARTAAVAVADDAAAPPALSSLLERSATTRDRAAAERARAVLGDEIATAGGRAPLAWARAAAGRDGRALLVPAGTHVCTVIADGAGGYGAGCRGGGDIAAGRTATVHADPLGDPGGVTVAVVVADDGAPPVVRHAGGGATAAWPDGNLAVVRVAAGDVLVTAGETIDASAYLAASR